MAENQNDQVVIAFYPSEDAAQQAADALKHWDKANDDVKLGAIGIITKEGDKVKTQVPHKTGKGMAVGAVVGVIAGALTGGLTVVGGLVGGGVLGGIAGRFMKRSVGLTEEDVQQIGAELDAGKAALVVACDDFEVDPTMAELAAAGGTVQRYSVASDAIAETAAAMAVVEETPAGEAESKAVAVDTDEVSGGQGFAPAGEGDWR